jgi:hypothetical protein
VLSQRFLRFYALALTILCRAIGVCFGLAGIGLVIAALMEPTDRVMRLFLALMGVGVGVGVFVARPITLAQLNSLRRSIGIEEPK